MLLIFVLFFFHSNVPDNKCSGQKWCKLFFTCIKLVGHFPASACALATIKWRRLGSLLALETLPRYEPRGDLWVKIIDNRVINIELVKLCTQNGPKLTMGQPNYSKKNITAELIIFNIHFLPALVEWNRLNPTLLNSKSYCIFKNSLLKTCRSVPKLTFNIHNPLHSWKLPHSPFIKGRFKVSNFSKKGKGSDFCQ